MKKSEDVVILFVDDELSVLSSLRRFLRKEPYRTLFASSGQEALDLVKENEVDIVVTDLRMPGMDGLELIDRLKTENPEILRLVLSATREIEETIAIINHGEVFQFISKPLVPDAFKKTILDAVDYHLMKFERKMLLEDLAASNSALKDALSTVNQVSAEKEKLLRQSQAVERKIEEQFLQSACPDTVKGVSLAAASVPSGHLDGDFFDFICYGHDCFDLVVGDVMGKGIQAALVGAGVKFDIVKALAQYSCRGGGRMNCPAPSMDSQPENRRKSLASVFADVHSRLVGKLMDLDLFVTLCYARFDIAKRKMWYIDCGHTKTILYRHSTGNIRFLKGENLPLGVEEHASYSPVELTLEEGDLLLFYSDGVTEAENADEECYGEQRLSALIAEKHRLPPEALVDVILSRVKSFTGKDRFADDFSCIVVKLTASEQQDDGHV